MKVSLSNKGYTLSGISADELQVVLYILETAKNRCFREFDKEDDTYYSGSDFVAVINGEQRNNFHNFVDGFWSAYEKMKNKLIN